MTTFDRHLLREWMNILIIVLVGLVGLLVIYSTLDDFRRVREMGATGMDAWMYFLIGVPKFLTVVLPVALLLSLLYSLGQMHRANEFTAMRAAGVGFTRITYPIWIVGFFCCGLMWWLNSSAVPWTVEETLKLEQSFQIAAQSELPADRRGAINAVVFANRPAQRMWFFNRYSRFSRKAYGATVDIRDATGGHRRIIAAEAAPDPAGGWRFTDGREQIFDADKDVVQRDEPFKDRVYPTFDEDPELMLLLGQPPGNLSFFGLRRVMRYYENESGTKSVPYAVRYFSQIAGAFAPLIVIAIAIPFAISGVRVNPAVGVSKSIGIFLLYYILSNLGLALATKQVLDPVWAAWVPNAAIGAMAIYLFARLR